MRTLKAGLKKLKLQKDSGIIGVKVTAEQVIAQVVINGRPTVRTYKSEEITRKDLLLAINKELGY